MLERVTDVAYLQTYKKGATRGPELFFLSDTAVSECLFVQRSAYVMLVKLRQKGSNFQFKMHNIQYSMDNVSNIYWTQCLYHLLKI
jgi:hypothetical protein